MHNASRASERVRALGYKPNEAEIRGFLEREHLKDDKVGAARVEEQVSEGLRMVRLPRAQITPLSERLRARPERVSAREAGRMDPLEWLRAMVVAAALRRRAHKDASVIAFRQSYLSGGVLPVDQV